jgi:hypothetical protein
MSKKMASIVLGYGLFLTVMGLVVRSVTPEQGKITFITAFAGGGLLVLCGIAALAGHKRRTWTVLTAIPIIYFFLSQTVLAWMPSTKGAGNTLAAWLITLMLLLTLGFLLYVLHGERSPDFYKGGTGPGDKLH